MGTNRRWDQIQRGIFLLPELAMHPKRIVHLVKGVHPGPLWQLDSGSIREFAPATIIDVGANTGQFSQAAHAVFPAAQIYAFEPLPNCFNQMQSRLAGIKTFQAYPAALGAENRLIVIHESISSPSSSILAMTESHADAFPWTEGGRDLEVELRQLDSFLPEMELTSPVLLKIDVQGYSLEVLQGSTATLKQCHLIVVETSVMTLYEGESTFDEVYTLLREAGFTFAGIVDQLKHPETDEILQVDAIFRRTV